MCIIPLLNIKSQLYQFKILKSAQYKMNKLGHIELILGPMFSGKSSEMLRKIRRYEHARKKCFIINYLNDNRYSQEDVASTHDKVTMKAVKTNQLKQVLDRAMQHDVVAIDQGQFFNDIVEISEQLANQGKIVIVAALDGTFQRKPFGNILNLIPLSEIVTKLSAVCIDCGAEAAFTKRTIKAQQIQLIGGAQSYKPVCRVCFMNSSSENKSVLEPNLNALNTNPEQVNTVGVKNH